MFQRSNNLNSNNSDTRSLDLVHAHTLFVKISICRRIQTETLHFLPHNDPIHYILSSFLHSNLNKNKESSHHEQDRWSTVETIQLGSNLLTGRTIVTIITEASRCRGIMIISTNTITTTELVVHLTTFHRAAIDRLQLHVICTHGILNHSTILGKVVKVVHTEEAQTKTTRTTTVGWCTFVVRKNNSGCRVIVIYILARWRESTNRLPTHIWSFSTFSKIVATTTISIELISRILLCISYSSS